MDNNKRKIKSNIHVIRVPEGEKKEDREKIITTEIIVENFPNLPKDINLQFQKAAQATNKTNPKKCTPRYIIAKFLKTENKGKILKSAREKQRQNN